MCDGCHVEREPNYRSSPVVTRDVRILAEHPETKGYVCVNG